MGNQESNPANPYFSDIMTNNGNEYTNQQYSSSLPKNFDHTISPMIDLEKEEPLPTKIYKPPFGGIWSIQLPKSLSPICRKSHFHVYSKQMQKIFIGYGIDIALKAKYLNTIWEFDLVTRKWNKLTLKNNEQSPIITKRKNSIATICENTRTLYIYGGTDEHNNYLTDLHSVDLTTGEMTLITQGINNNPQSIQFNNNIITNSPPSPRKGQIIQFYNNRIYIWGGQSSDKSVSNDISVYDLLSNTWATMSFPNNNSILGRHDIPHQLVDNHIYVYGGSTTKTLVDIEINEPQVQNAIEAVKYVNIREINCIGAAPPENVYSAGMVYIESQINSENHINIELTNGVDLTSKNKTQTGFIVYFGGKSSHNYSLIYGLDLSRFWWFVLHVSPDGDSVSYVDGKVSDNGLFMTPRIFNFAVGYDITKREIVACAAQQKSLKRTESNKVSNNPMNIPPREARNRKRRSTDIGEILVVEKPVLNSFSSRNEEKYNNFNQQFSHMLKNTGKMHTQTDLPSLRRPPAPSCRAHEPSSLLTPSSGGKMTYYNGNNSNNIRLTAEPSGFSTFEAGEKLFVVAISNVLAGLSIKEDMLKMLKYYYSETENAGLTNNVQ